MSHFVAQLGGMIVMQSETNPHEGGPPSWGGGGPSWAGFPDWYKNLKKNINLQWNYKDYGHDLGWGLGLGLGLGCT